MKRRVAITGVGLVTPVGNDVATTWDALLAGRSGGAPISLFDASGFPTRIAAEVKDFRDDDSRRPQAPEVHEPLASLRARRGGAGVARCRHRPTPDDRHALGLRGRRRHDDRRFRRPRRHAAAHSARGRRARRRSTAERPGRRTIRMVFCRSQATAGIALLTRRYGIHGYATSVHTACASGGQALGTAMKLIRRGAVDRVLAGGFDSMISPIGLSGLLPAVGASRRTTTRRSARAGRSMRRATASCSGEGAGFLVLEEWEAARRRGARIYAELAGDGNSLSCYRITDSPPDGDGPIQAMRAGARRRRRDHRRDVDYLNAHGTSTAMNDRSETRRDRASSSATTSMRVDVSSTKSTMGHLIAAAGAVEVAVCALAIARGEMPVNANLAERDVDCDLNFVVGYAAARARSRRAVELVRLRRLQQLRRRPPSRTSSSTDRRDAARSVVVTGHAVPCARPACARRHPRRRSSRGARRSPDRAMGHDGWPCRIAGGDRRLQSARAGRRPQAAQAHPAHRSRWDCMRPDARSSDRASSRIATRSSPMPRQRTATAPASTSAPAAATTRTSTTTSR